MADLTFTPENFPSRKEDLRLGTMKTFKLINGCYIIPILANGYRHVCMETPSFFSQGIHQSKVTTNQKDVHLFITCPKDTCAWLDTFMKELWYWAYPLVLDAIKSYVNLEKAQNRTFPDVLTTMLNAGLLLKDRYVKDAWNGKDAFFLKVLPQALVYTQQSSSNILNGRPASQFASDEMIVKRGNYKAHIVLRHIYVSKDDSGGLKLQLSMQSDQLYCISEDYPCPMEPVMKTEMFSIGNDPVNDFLDNLALDYNPEQVPQMQTVDADAQQANNANGKSKIQSTAADSQSTNVNVKKRKKAAPSGENDSKKSKNSN